MNRVTIILITALLMAETSTRLSAQDHHHQTVTGGGVFPAGWSARPDSGGSVEDVKFVTMQKDYHLTLGTSAVIYRQSDHGSGPFHTVATFTQTKDSGKHPEGYGLFFGGKALDSINQQYIYFLVRGDGQYLIKRRVGNNVTEVKPWTTHAAIKQVDANGRSTNQLAIEAKRNSTKVMFMANGQTVDSMTVAADDMNGVIGLRANHDLDLHIGGFAIHR